MTEVLLVCAANICRSVMAGAILARRLSDARMVHVSSAGMVTEGYPPPPEVISVMADYGADVSQHRSRMLSVDDLNRADLILTVARAQLRHVVVVAPSAWPRAFTLKELARRGGQIGPRRPGESLARWLARAHAGRTHGELMGDDIADDIEDPYGGPPHAYAVTAALIDRLVSRLAALCWGGTGEDARYYPHQAGGVQPRPR